MPIKWDDEQPKASGIQWDDEQPAAKPVTEKTPEQLENDKLRGGEFYKQYQGGGLKKEGEGLPFDLMGEIAERVPVVGSAAKGLGQAAYAATRAPFSERSFGEIWDQIRLKDKDVREKYAKENPITDIGLNIAGGAAIPMIPALKAAQGAGKLAKLGTGLTNVGVRAGEAAALTGADEFIKGTDDPAEAAAYAAAAGGGLSAVGKLAKTVGVGGARLFAKKVLNWPVEKIDRYLAIDPALRKQAKTEEGFKQATQSLKSDIQRPITEVKGQFKAIEKQIREQKGALQAAKESTREALASAKLAIKERTIDPDKLGEIVAARQNLQRSISQGSSNAFDLLADSNQVVDFRPWMAQVSGSINKNKIGDVVLGTEGVGQVQKVLGKLQEINQTNETTKMDMVNVKQFIQYLDELTNDVRQASASGTYSPSSMRGLSALRDSMDRYLKRGPNAVQGYEQAMKPVAEMTRLQKSLDNVLGKYEEKYGENLLKLSKRGPELGTFDRDMGRLGELQKIGGGQFMDELGAVRSEKLRGMSGDKLRRSLPEFKREEQIGTGLKGLAEQRESKKELVDLLSGRPDALVKNLSRSEPTDLGVETLKNIGRYSGDDFVKRAQDLATIKEMSSRTVQGSRATNLGAIIGYALGGDIGSLVAGGAAGAASDFGGRQAFRNLVDISDALNRNPATATIGNAIKKASERGPRAAVVTLYAAAQSNPEVRQLLEQIATEKQQQRGAN